MELKSKKNLLCLVVVGLLDLPARGQSDVTSAERRGVFSDLRPSHFLQSGEEESQCKWFRVLPPPLSLSHSLSLSQSWGFSLWDRLLSFDLAPLSRNLSFILFFSSDLINCFFGVFWGVFLSRRSRIDRKITFN